MGYAKLVLVEDHCPDRGGRGGKEGRRGSARSPPRSSDSTNDEQAFFSLPVPLEIAEKNIPVAVREAPGLDRPLDDVAVEKLTMPAIL